MDDKQKFYQTEAVKEKFDAKQLVENIALKTLALPASSNVNPEYDTEALYDAFVEAISDLSKLYENTLTKTESLENRCREEEERLKRRVAELQQRHKASLVTFQELDDRINYVAVKVVHLGDQLESINIPRMRAVEAQNLINYFDEFLENEPLKSDVFTDSNLLYEAAHVIQKLMDVVQEFPEGEFVEVKKHIAAKYDEIERQLIEKFIIAHNKDDRIKMKEIAAILSSFKHYSECVDAFIEASFQPINKWDDIFPNLKNHCTKTYGVMKEVFDNPDQVLVTAILIIYQDKILNFIVKKLNKNVLPLEAYLKLFYDLYKKTVDLNNDLSFLNVGNDPKFLDKITKRIFQSYFQSYIIDETIFLNDKFKSILQKYYDSINHQKKPLQSGTFYEFKRKIQGNVNSSGEILLSQSVFLSLFQETRNALKRCQMLSSSTDLAPNAEKIIDKLFHHFFNNKSALK